MRPAGPLLPAQPRPSPSPAPPLSSSPLCLVDLRHGREESCAVSARGRPAAASAARAHRAAAGRVPARGRPVDGHGVRGHRRHGQADHRHAAQAAALHRGGHVALRVLHRLRTRLHALAAHDAPRHQAGQHLRQQVGGGQGGRPRPRTHPGRAAGQGRERGGHAVLHVARGHQRRAVLVQDGHLEPRMPRLRDGHAQSTIRGHVRHTTHTHTYTHTRPTPPATPPTALNPTPLTHRFRPSLLSLLPPLPAICTRWA